MYPVAKDMNNTHKKLAKSRANGMMRHFLKVSDSIDPSYKTSTVKEELISMYRWFDYLESHPEIETSGHALNCFFKN